ncbi:unnamed protein product [Spirodela intermedia]|uniref:Uncharacterized protein n=1 Tax=Spirodela intermedia TaxID=51605 RepID=A0A7I8JFJ0_SPIIN|nr:unnamed protein product [Spirodela intermedia]CAA6668899.1 unnamed protein product [Spirodela intermedia]
MDPSGLRDLGAVGDIESGIAAGHELVAVGDGEAASADASFACPEESVALAAKKVEPKKVFQKPPKPPRPPMKPCLDAADRRLIREMSELAMLKRTRTERLKSSRKMKNSRPSSSNNSSLCALFVTLLFCLVIVWEGT